MIQSGKTKTTNNKININYYFNYFKENIIDEYYEDAPMIDTTEDSWEVYDG
jgi:hypothetical protein